MEKNEISSKIIDIKNDFLGFKDITEKRLEVLEEGLYKKFEDELQTKSIEAYAQVEKSNFGNFLRTGQIKAYEGNLETKTAKESSFNVEGASYGMINVHLERFSAIRRLAGVQFISYDSFDIIVEESGGEATWGAEEEKKKYLKKSIKTHEAVSQPKATLKLIEDVKFDVENYMIEKIAESFWVAEEKAFLFGNGSETPRGILTYDSGKTIDFIERIEGKIDTESILSLIDSLDSFYMHDVAFLMNKETESLIKNLKDNTGRYIWGNRTAEVGYNNILGFPILLSPFMPKPEQGKLAIIFGNFKKGYQIIEKSGYNIIRDPFTEKPFVKFYTTKKIGGDVIDGRALKVLKVK